MLINENTANTRTYQCRVVSPKFLDKINVDYWFDSQCAPWPRRMELFKSTSEFHGTDFSSLYVVFYILTKLLIGGNNMVALYVALIINGRRSFDKVPDKFKDAVRADLEALGLTENGDPV